MTVQNNKQFKKYIFVYIQYSVITSILFGAAMALKFDFGRSIIAGIWFGFGGGLVISLLAIIKDYESTKNLPSEALQLKQHREYYTNGEAKKVFEDIIHIIKNIEIIKKIKVNEEKFHIKAYTKLSKDSLGEKICFKITVADNYVNVIVTSEPRLKSVILDNGKNYKNMLLIEKNIKKHFKIYQ